VDSDEGAEEDSAPVAVGASVTLTDREPVPESDPVLTVALRESTAVTDAVTLALSTLQVLVVAFSLLALVLDATTELLDELGSSSIEATMRISAHWSPMERS
jgi:hypothetical protein